MNLCLNCFQIWYGCSLGISDDLINFWDASIKNKMAAAAIKNKIAVRLHYMVILRSQNKIRFFDDFSLIVSL